MPAASTVYGFAESDAFQGNIKWTTDTIKMALMGSGYTPALSTDHHWSDISANETTGTGYTAGGNTMASLTATETAANSWALTWTASHAYVFGDVVKPGTANGFLYMCVVAGTSAASGPVFPTTYGATVTDGGVTWACMGRNITVFSSASVTWSAATVTASYAVIYDAQTGTAATEPLVNLQDFGGSQTATGSTFTVAPDATYGWFYTFS